MKHYSVYIKFLHKLLYFKCSQEIPKQDFLWLSLLILESYQWETLIKQKGDKIFNTLFIAIERFRSLKIIFKKSNSSAFSFVIHIMSNVLMIMPIDVKCNGSFISNLSNQLMKFQFTEHVYIITKTPWGWLPTTLMTHQTQKG